MTEGHESKGNTVKIYLFILFALFVTPVGAASFDCAKASTPTEKAVCSDPGLSKLDETLANNYKSVMAAYKEAGFGGETDLKKEQQQWNKDKNSCGATVQCLTVLYTQRANELCETAIAPGVVPQNCVTVDANLATTYTPPVTDTVAKSDAELGLTPYDPANDPDNAPAPQPQQSNQMPIEVKAGGNDIYITSLENNLTVDQVIPNRGNCATIDFKQIRERLAKQYHKAEAGGTWEGRLNYGDQMHTSTTLGCVIRELVINTNRGSWTVTFQ